MGEISGSAIHGIAAMIAAIVVTLFFLALGGAGRK